MDMKHKSLDAQLTQIEAYQATLPEGESMILPNPKIGQNCYNQGPLIAELRAGAIRANEILADEGSLIPKSLDGVIGGVTGVAVGLVLTSASGIGLNYLTGKQIDDRFGVPETVMIVGLGLAGYMIDRVYASKKRSEVHTHESA